jgi:polyisoprenyl-phosphate glycosyltransferase
VTSTIALSVVVPCFNEADNLGVLHDRLSKACEKAVGEDYEIVYVNDGSRDSTWAQLYSILQKDAHVVGINLSRNFGHQIAVTAGLEHTQGTRVFVIDGDLQDPPELLEPMLEKMIATEADVVYGQRIRRHGESAFKLATAAAFYRVFRLISDVDMPVDAGDFRLISRRVVETLQEMPERQRFLRGMVAWTGFRQVAFPYERQKRLSGKTKYPFRKMLLFSIDAFTGFSIAPLRLAMILATFSVAISVLMACYVAVGLVTGHVVPGWASVMTAVVFFSGVQLLVLGIIGEYIGRMMMEVKHRPLYLVDAVARKGEGRSLEPKSNGGSVSG